MMSDQEYCFFDDDYNDYFSPDDDDEDDEDIEFFDDDDDHCIYLSGYHDDDDMDDVYCGNHKQAVKLSADQSERKTIYKELSMQDPNELLKNPLSLIDISARKVALNFPFAYVEDRTPPIPENVQLKIIAHSFPQSMEKIKRYCMLNNGSSTEFERAIRNLKSVKDLKQIGFHLSANIESRGYREIWYGCPAGKKSPYLYVTIKFDRGKITETHCPCETSSSWCLHVIAVCLARIFLHDKCVFKPPLSDSINNLKSYAQLRTFTQYLIAEFSDGRIIESAQNVLDRMLTQRNDEHDAISEVWGAPDPTAGPGMNEYSHWLICEEGLKSRCVSMINNSDITEGCWGLNVADLSPSSSVMEWWRNFQLDKPVVEEYFSEFSDIAGNPSFSYNYYRQSFTREKSQEISKFLKTCEELLKDDFSYSLKAVQTFTVQLLDVLQERNQRDHYRYDKKVFESNSHLGCIPRPKQCWLFRDQLARLWRLLVLNPTITIKKRGEIFTTLEVLEAKLPPGGSGPNKKQYMQWDSQKHIQCLKDFSWDTLQLGEDPFKNNNLVEVTIAHCVVIETSQTTAKDDADQHVLGTRLDADDLTDRFSYPVSLLCGSFSSSVTVFCYMIEALGVYGQTEQAVHLAMAVALSIVRYYNTWLEGQLRVPVKDHVCVDYDGDEESPQEAAPANAGKRGKRTRKAAYARKKGRGKNAKKNEGEKEKAAKRSSKEALFHEETGIIPITSLAFLLCVLEENEALVAEMLKLLKVQCRGLLDEEMMECDDVTSDARSLIFRLGVVGLAMPKVQAPSLQIQVEWFNWEVYITDKVTRSAVTSSDVEFLRKMTSRVISLCSAGRGFMPPYTLVTALFNHLYKTEDTVSDECEDGLAVALKTMETSPRRAFAANIQRRMFFESCRRHWVKLAETVVYATTHHNDHLNRVLKSLFAAVAMIGSLACDVAASPQPASGAKKPSQADHKVTFIEQMIPEKVVATLYLAHSLVQQADRVRLNEPGGIKDKLPIAIGVPMHSPTKTERKNYEVLVVQGRKMLVKEQPVSEQRRLLYETAIRVCTHAYAVKNRAFHELQLDSYTVEYNFPEFLQRNLRWLCRISNKIDVKAFDLILERQRSDPGPFKCFNDDEVIRLCTQMLESDQKHQDCVWIMVKDVLLALMKFDSQKKVNDILSLCRNVEKERPAKRALLFPFICKELLTFLPTTTVADSNKLDFLVRAMKLMYTLFKDTESDDNQDSLAGVVELFADIPMSPGDKPGTSEESPVAQPLDGNLKLSFDLGLETVKYIDEKDRLRGYEARRRFESLCEVVAFVATTACTTPKEKSATPLENKDLKAPHAFVRDNVDAFEEVYISRFVEVLCNTVKDCLLLTDFYFEISSRLLATPQHGSFGRDKVLLSDDIKVSLLSKSCSSLSVLLKRCIVGLLETLHGDLMKDYLKDTTQETKNYLKSRARQTKFYYSSSLVSVLDVLKRLMTIAEDDDFESFSRKLSSRHPVIRVAVEEVNSKNPMDESPRDYEESMLPDDLISSLILRRMLSPALACFDYDSDGWRY